MEGRREKIFFFCIYLKFLSNKFKEVERNFCVGWNELNKGVNADR